jgi:hypothetical protein
VLLFPTFSHKNMFRAKKNFSVMRRLLYEICINDISTVLSAADAEWDLCYLSSFGLDWCTSFWNLNHFWNFNKNSRGLKLDNRWIIDWVEMLYLEFFYRIGKFWYFLKKILNFSGKKVKNVSKCEFIWRFDVC